MGYGNPDLEEVKTSDLFVEIARRIHAAAAQQCPYCNQPLDSHTCKYKGKVADRYNYPLVVVFFEPDKKS